jgi:polysaccharide export outer membrane protein
MMPRQIDFRTLFVVLLGLAVIGGTAGRSAAQGALGGPGVMADPGETVTTARSRVAADDPVRGPFVPPTIRERVPASAPAGAPEKASPPVSPENLDDNTAVQPVPQDEESRNKAGAVGLASTDAPERYKVGPEDVILLSVWGEPDSSGDFKVSPQGTIHHFLLGEVGVAGRTTAEIGEVLRASLAANYLRDPRVDVRVVEYHAQKVFVYGQVAHPGTYELRGDTNVLKLLLDAGGPTSRASDACALLHVKKTPHGDQVETRTIVLRDLLERGDLSQNHSVADGDVIFVPDKDKGTATSLKSDERVFYVLGEVKNPGSYRYKEGTSAMSAILEAGGFSEYARANKTKLVRGEGNSQKTRTLKMGEVVEKGNRSLDVKLQPGDVVVVPRSLF